MRTKNDSWPDDRVTALRAMIADGISCAQIAKKLGGVSRSAVLGKVFRLGLRSNPAKRQPRVYTPPVKQKRLLPNRKVEIVKQFGQQPLPAIQSSDIACVSLFDRISAAWKPLAPTAPIISADALLACLSGARAPGNRPHQSVSASSMTPRNNDAPVPMQGTSACTSISAATALKDDAAMKHEITTTVNLEKVDHSQIKRIKIWYPAKPELVVYRRDCRFNGERFLRELLAYGWQAVGLRGGVLHLDHPQAAASAERLN
jgi:GcrA cell cycle regulator